MQNSLKRLPLKVTSFRNLIERNFIFVDKTDLLYQLITNEDEDNAFFLSRPRRFGKSLLLDTLAEIFRGDKNLFKGLKIGSTDYEFEKFPVLKFDMGISGESPEKLETAISEMLNAMATEEGFKLDASGYGIALRELLEKISDKYQKKVVVLIDEYDDPVSSNVDNTDLAKKNSEILRDFYAGFKACNDYLRFVLVTGVTRYAMMGFSAGFNHLTDISFDEEYSTICGFTASELDHYFAKHISRALEKQKSKGEMPKSARVEDLKKKILDWYDGYSWDGNTRVLNPISVLNFLKNAQFKKYWVRTYPSTNTISGVIKQNPWELTQDKLEKIEEVKLTWSSVGSMKPVPLLFQTGYLTVDKVTQKNDLLQYSFRTPNKEVAGSFHEAMNEGIFNLLGKNKTSEENNLKKNFLAFNEGNLTNRISALYSSLPAIHHEPKESFYHSLLHSYCFGLIPEIRSEEPASIGTPDILITINDNTYVVIELKYAPDTEQKDVDSLLVELAQEALKAIKEKRYGERYRQAGKNLIEVGLGVWGRGEVKVLFRDSRQ
jgi:hypothetical protein